MLRQAVQAGRMAHTYGKTVAPGRMARVPNDVEFLIETGVLHRRVSVSVFSI